jgi:hypothetical protein
MPTHRTGLLIVRAWVESGSADPLRANVRVADDVEAGTERSVTLAKPALVADLVETWLQGIVDEAVAGLER